MSGKVNEPLVNQLATAVGQGQSVRAASKALGIPERTGRRYAASPEFKAKVIEIASLINSQAVALARMNVVRTHTRLGQILTDKSLDVETVIRAIKLAVPDFIALESHTTLAGQLRDLEAPPDDEHG